MSGLLEKILERFPSARRNGSSWSAMCPAHADRNPSLSISEKDGKVLLRCHAGCEVDAVCAAAGLELRDLFESRAERSSDRKVVATYDYEDEAGKLLYQVVRYEPKDFRQRRPDGKGGWLWNLEGTRRVLYNLPKVLAAPEVLVVEGEKDVETAGKLGLVATTNAGGAGKWRAEYSAALAGRRVVAVPDNDEPGRRHVAEVAAALRGVAASFSAAVLPEGIKDLSELVEKGFSREAVVDLIGRAAPVPGPLDPFKADASAASANGDFSLADMPTSVLDGRLGELCSELMLPGGRFPVAYAWPALLAVASAMVPRRVPQQRINLYVAIVGPVHTGKSQAIYAAQQLMGCESPVLMNMMSGSAEALARRCKDAAGEPRLFSPDELGHMLDKSKIENASFPYILSRAFYENRFELHMGKREVAEFNASLSIVGGIVDARFEDLFSHSTTAGLYDRFVFGQCPDGYAFDYFPFEHGAATSAAAGVFVEPEVWQAKSAWLKEDSELEPRVVEMALRAATVCAAFDGRTLLRAEDLAPALEFSRYQMRIRRTLRPNEGENLEGKIALKMLAYLKRRGAGKYVSRRTLLRDVGAYRYGPSVADRALDVLHANGEVEITSRQRPVMVRLLEEDKEE